MDKIILEAKEREIGSLSLDKLRRNDRVPGVVYGNGKKNQFIDVDSAELEKVYSKVGSNKIVSLKVGDGRAKNVIVYDVQTEPLKGKIIHIDLYNVKMDEVLRAEVPLRFVGESTAVYKDEGTLFKNLESVEVECLPSDLPENFVIDISSLDDFEKTITVADIEIPEGVKLLIENPNTLVVRVEAPRSEEELSELETPIEENLPEGVEEEEPIVLADDHEEDKDRLSMK